MIGSLQSGPYFAIRTAEMDHFRTNTALICVFEKISGNFLALSRNLYLAA